MFSLAMLRVCLSMTSFSVKLSFLAYQFYTTVRASCLSRLLRHPSLYAEGVRRQSLFLVSICL